MCHSQYTVSRTTTAVVWTLQQADGQPPEGVSGSTTKPSVEVAADSVTDQSLADEESEMLSPSSKVSTLSQYQLATPPTSINVFSISASHNRRAPTLSIYAVSPLSSGHYIWGSNHAHRLEDRQKF